MSAAKVLMTVVKPEGAEPIFKAGDSVRISKRFPIGHFRVPNYIRGKSGVVESVIKPAAVNNEEEGFGRNAGPKRHYYRIAIPLTELWPKYAGSVDDGLRIEVFETWLERS
jgi:nitrile hydratase